MPTTTGTDSLKCCKSLVVNGKNYAFFSIKAAEATLGDLSRLPFSLKIVLENLLRRENGTTVTVNDLKAIARWLKDKTSSHEIAYLPARVLMQDFTGVPAVADLAAMRDAMQEMGGDPKKINPLCPVDLVIDHSVMVDYFGTRDAFAKNVDLEFRRNSDRYKFLRWAQQAFDTFRVVPPGTGICHQVNLEYLAQVVWTDTDQNGQTVAYPDTLVGTDSHTTMINGLSVLGWGVGGIEAEAAMLGQPVSMLIPDVIGVRLTGELPEGTTATDLVLAVTEKLRKQGVVEKFVEFFGDGLDSLTLADRATLANMAPEYGATCGIFPVDGKTIDYLRFTGRDEERIALVEAYAKAQGLWRDASAPDPVFTDTITLDLSSIVPSLAGPKRPQDRVPLDKMAENFKAAQTHDFKVPEDKQAEAVPVEGEAYTLPHGAVVISAITSCTNTSNPNLLIAAGLLARKARARGLTVKPWVKTSLAPGSQVVSDYLVKAGLQDDLDALGFTLVGYGCTTCIGNSGALPDKIAKAVETGNLTVAAVLSGNRNFEGRVNPHTKANYLASPPLCVAYALAGSVAKDLRTEPLGTDTNGAPVFLKDIWPTSHEIAATLAQCLTPEMFRSRYANVFKGSEQWQTLAIPQGLTYTWEEDSTYIKRPPLFENMGDKPEGIPSINEARILALFGDSITTDHISPAGDIKKASPAGDYLMKHGTEPLDFNSYGSRRGNHEVMMRGTFANIRIKNEMTPQVEGGVTRYIPTDEILPIYTAAMKYTPAPLVILTGKEYGTGSSRDWAAKGTRLLGVRAVIAESFERIHRSNLVGMGVLPLTFKDGTTRKTLALDGTETLGIKGLDENTFSPRTTLTLVIERANGEITETPVLCRVDTLDEVEYIKHGGVLRYVLRGLASTSSEEYPR